MIYSLQVQNNIFKFKKENLKQKEGIFLLGIKELRNKIKHSRQSREKQSLDHNE